MSLMKISDIKFDHLFAGICGGVVSTGLLHPLDLVKIRLQVNDGDASRPTYKGIVDCSRQLYRSSGVRVFYQGVVPNIWGAGLSWGFYFFFYNNIKMYMQDTDSKKSLSAMSHMLAAAESGVLTLALTNPIWVAKTRMCLQYENTAVASRDYSSLARVLLNIWKQEGIRGFYKGFIPGIFGVSHGALQFMSYEELKKLYFSHYNLPVDTRLGPLEYITFAAISKMFAVVTTYPYQVVRSRLQDQHRQYSGVMNVVTQTYRNEGWKAFYKGLIPNLARVTPACCITFVIYESFMTYSKSTKY